MKDVVAENEQRRGSSRDRHAKKSAPEIDASLEVGSVSECRGITRGKVFPSQNTFRNFLLAPRRYLITPFVFYGARCFFYDSPRYEGKKIGYYMMNTSAIGYYVSRSIPLARIGIGISAHEGIQVRKDYLVHSPL